MENFETPRSRELQFSDIRHKSYDQEYFDINLMQTVDYKRQMQLERLLQRTRVYLLQLISTAEQMKIDYGETVEEDTYDSLKDRYELLKSTYFDSLSKIVQGGQTRYPSLLYEHIQTLVSNDELKRDINILERTATPRPGWNRVAPILGYSPEEWNRESNGKTSEQLRRLVMNRYSGGEFDFFDGDPSQLQQEQSVIKALGTDSDILPCLRTEGQFVHRHLSKAQLIRYIHSIMKAKKRYNLAHWSALTGSYVQPAALKIFIFDHFLHMFGKEQVAFEICYNIWEATNRYFQTPVVDLFRKMLVTDFDEEIYFRPRDDLAQLLYFLNEETGKDKRIKDQVKIYDFYSALYTMYPTREPAKLVALCKAALIVSDRHLRHPQQDIVYVPALLVDTAELDSNRFLKRFRDDLYEEREMMVNYLIHQLSYGFELRWAIVSQTLVQIDPYISTLQLNRLLCNIFQVKQPNAKARVSRSDFITRIQSLALFRHHKDNAKTARQNDGSTLGDSRA
ncbi:hypothetical protein SNEBB_004046 [Seison nebaliae]|nr:hypothetical protein SNEBB_004046 [Seison nebaliae]